MIRNPKGKARQVIALLKMALDLIRNGYDVVSFDITHSEGFLKFSLCISSDAVEVNSNDEYSV